ncbi:hypothetical protein Golob_027560 [Gossypium lobatum]|uniref:Uncharacterized protein n=1 Tax=Gossypium lobatum TaxID=34289 RepID=A0A7J8NHH4_9ROSI|nr:hypothetical protein [Gossypium lobatum]
MSPLRSRTIIPEADLDLFASKAASNCIMSSVFSFLCLFILAVFKAILIFCQTSILVGHC